MAGGLNSKRKKRSIEGSVVIEDVPLRWVLASEPQWSNSSDGYRGMCFSVKILGEARRELTIEYPFLKDRNGRPFPCHSARRSHLSWLREQSVKHWLKAGTLHHAAKLLFSMRRMSANHP